MTEQIDDERSEGPVLPSGLSHDTIRVDPFLRRELGIRHVTSVTGPLLRDGDALPPGQINVEFRIVANGLTGQLAFQVIDGRRTLTGMLRLHNDSRPALRQADLRSLVVGEINQDLDVLLDWHRGSDRDAYRKSFRRFAEAEISKPGRGRRLTEKALVQYAVRYSELEGTVGVYQVMAREENLSATYIRNVIYQARKAGYLEPTVRGRANFRLTPLAERLIAEEDTKNQVPDDTKQENHGNRR